MGGIDGLPPTEGFEKVIFPRVANRQAFVTMQVLIAIDMYKEHTMRPTNKFIITFSLHENLLLYSVMREWLAYLTMQYNDQR